jgi:hypothetical protein
VIKLREEHEIFEVCACKSEKYKKDRCRPTGKDKKDRQCTYNIILRHDPATTVAAESNK